MATNPLKVTRGFVSIVKSVKHVFVYTRPRLRITLSTQRAQGTLFNSPKRNFSNGFNGNASGSGDSSISSPALKDNLKTNMNKKHHQMQSEHDQHQTQSQGWKNGKKFSFLVAGSLICATLAVCNFRQKDRLKQDNSEQSKLKEV